jgi:hypothetical protein
MLLILGTIFVFSPINSEPRLVAHKLLIGVCALIVGHIATKSLYDYISLSTLLDKDKFNELPDSIKFLGACVLRSVVVSAFILGVMLGL